MNTGCARLVGIDDTEQGDTVDAAPPEDAGPVTANFQHGVDGYAGVEDTHLDDRSPTLNNGANIEIIWEGDSADQFKRTGLLRFNALFSDSQGPIPVGASIIEATLYVEVSNASTDDPGELREVLVPWAAATVTWNTFGDSDGAGPKPEHYGDTILARLPMTAGAPEAIDVTSSVQAWAADPTTNHGWILMGRGGALDAAGVHSSEAAESDKRPRLEVTWTGP